MELKGKHAFITGAGKRVGRKIAETLIEKGVRVTAHYRESKDAAEDLKRWAKNLGVDVFPVQADLKSNASLDLAIEASSNALGAPNILINSASDFYPTPALECTEEQWDALQTVNLRGQFFLAQAFAKAWKKDRKASSPAAAIINVGDIYAEKPRRDFTPYVASKAGLLMMSKNLALEWAPAIRVNTVSPGPVLLPDWYTPEQAKKAENKTLLQRWGTPEDIAQGVLFLLQNEYVTGFNLKIDGGRSLN